VYSYIVVVIVVYLMFNVFNVCIYIYAYINKRKRECIWYILINFAMCPFFIILAYITENKIRESEII
jgi:hypothetical protein